ncbi:sulfatase-like hydrolase/transferase [Sorangium sp. So ce1128]
MYDHVVFISLDTLRSDCIGANPYKLWPSLYPGLRAPVTPVLDALAAESAFFPNCIAAAPYTAASHASFFTGLWPLRHGVFEFFNRGLDAPTIFTLAKRLGARTLFKVDFPIILGSFLGFDRDVDEYIVEDDAAFLAALDPARPSISFAHFGGVHVPYGFHNLKYGGPAYVRRVEQLEAEIPDAGPLSADRLVETYRDDDDLELLLRYKRIVQYYYSRGRYEKLFGLYLEGVEHFLEARFRPFLEMLSGRLAGSKWLLVLFGDHGEEYSEGSYGHHNSLAEGVIRVPVLLRGAGVEPGLFGDRIRAIDVVPTVMDLLGVAPEEQLRCDGTSLAPTLLTKAPYPVRVAYSQTYAAETREYVEFQRRMLAANKKTGNLHHVRYKEAVYEGAYKLIRQNFQFTEDGGIWGLRPCQPRITLERARGPEGFEPCQDAAVEERLSAQLDDYNTLCPDVEQRDVNEDVRRQLQSMGYRI